jgi:hypothetical protein
VACRRRQRHAGLARRQVGDEPVEAAIGFAHGDDAFPAADDLDDGGERPAAKNGGNDQKAGAAGEDVFDDQPAAQAEHQRGGAQLHELGDGVEAAGPVGSLGLLDEQLVLQGQPAFVEGGPHAHGFDDLAVAQAVAGKGLRLAGNAVGFLERRVGVAFGQVGDQGLQEGAHHRQEAEDGMDAEHRDDEDERHGRIHEGIHQRTRQKVAHAAQVLDGLHADARQAAQAGFENGVEDAFADRVVEAARDLAQDAAARPFEHLHDGVGEEDHEGEHGERHAVAAVDHPVIDFEHVPGGRQHQHADEKAEKERPAQCRTFGVDGLVEPGMLA